jgi:RHS repeat-associated protein
LIAAPGPINKKAVREYLDSGSFGTTETDYTGQILDAGSGLHFYNARYYDSTFGRFISADEIIPGTGDPSAFNRYSYTLNNPLKYTDPTGNHSDQ